MNQDDRFKQLEDALAALTIRVQKSEDEQAVEKLHYLYGYLIDKCLYKETVDLFTEDCRVYFFGGVFIGKKGAKRLFVDRFGGRFVHGVNGPIDGFLLDHPQMQVIVDVQEDGETALMRGRCMMQAGRHKDYGEDTRQWWEGGIYENTYKKVDGVWRIHVLNYNPQWYAPYDTGWSQTDKPMVPYLSATYPEDPLGPDQLLEDVWVFPAHKVVPFHMNHPVTGAPIEAERYGPDTERDKERLAQRRVEIAENKTKKWGQ